MKYERKFVNISAFRRAALLSVSRRDTARSVALLRGRKDALLSDAESTFPFQINNISKMEIKKDFFFLSIICDANTARRVNCHVKQPLLAVPMNVSNL